MEKMKAAGIDDDGTGLGVSATDLECVVERHMLKLWSFVYRTVSRTWQRFVDFGRYCSYLVFGKNAVVWKPCG